MSYYAYLRVSTMKQDVARQEQAIKEFEKQKGITIPKENYFVDYYTGKTFDRENYQKLKNFLRAGDYLIIKEVDRLGRDWTGIKNEWTSLQDMEVKIIIIDLPILSDPLPNEQAQLTGLSGRLIKEQMLTLMCYSAQLEREKISQRTKEALAEKKLHGTSTGNPIGHPRGKNSNKENFLRVLRALKDGYSQRESSAMYDYPITTMKNELKELYQKYGTRDYGILLTHLTR